MAEHHDDHAAGGNTIEAGHGHGEIHMPPNSLVPVCLALALGLTFVGFLISPLVWVPGLVLVVACLAGWARAAASEYRALP